MQYNGKVLIELTPENWDGKSRKMLVWDDTTEKPYEEIVVGYYPQDNCWMSIGPYSYGNSWEHCAEIPTEEFKIEIKPKYDFVENLLKPAQEQNGCITIPKRAVEQMSEMEKAFGIVYKENEELKEIIKSLRVERTEMANSVSSAVWNELMNRAKNIDGPVNTTMAGFGFNDISDIVLNKILEYKPENGELYKSENTQRKMIYRETAEWLSNGDFGFKGISDIGLTKILNYKPEKEVRTEKKSRRMTNRELAEWLAKGNGCCELIENPIDNPIIFTDYNFTINEANNEVPVSFRICAWNETEWHEPMIECIDCSESETEFKLDQDQSKKQIDECTNIEPEKNSEPGKIEPVKNTLYEVGRKYKCYKEHPIASKLYYLNCVFDGFTFKDSLNDTHDANEFIKIELEAIDHAKRTRRMTYSELSSWLNNGTGWFKIGNGRACRSVAYLPDYPPINFDDEVSPDIRIREWFSDTWHEPLVEEDI